MSSQAPPVQSESPIAVPEHPALAPGVRLVGELQGTGFQNRQWLLQRDGHFVQVTELLYRTAEQADGSRTLEEIAAGVTDVTDRIVTADHVRYFLQTRLIPLGLIAAASDTVVDRSSVDQVRSPLAVNLRANLLKPGAIEPFARMLQPLFAPLLLIPILIAIALAHVWLYLVAGIGGAYRAALETPGALPVALVILIASTAFHEFGHAAALRYGGGRARGMGVGLYLVFPVFYTDVTESYRLGRWARVRVDLGGFYFHLMFAAGIIGLYRATGYEFLLYVVLLIDLDILYQCLPFVRFDGYWALADLTGIPDFFSQTTLFLRSLRPVPGSGIRLPQLKSWVKAVFLTYIVVTIPMLWIFLFLLIRSAPRVVMTTWDALVPQAGVLASAWSTGDGVGMATSAAQILMLGLQLLAVLYLLFKLTRDLMRGVWKWSKPIVARRLVAAATGIAVLFRKGYRGMSGQDTYPGSPSMVGSAQDDDTMQDPERAEIERTIQDIGAQYMAHIRVLSQMLERYYHEQFEAHADQVAELTRQLVLKDEQIDELRRHLSDADQDLSAPRATGSLLQRIERAHSAKVDRLASEWRGRQTAQVSPEPVVPRPARTDSSPPAPKEPSPLPYRAVEPPEPEGRSARRKLALATSAIVPLILCGVLVLTLTSWFRSPHTQEPSIRQVEAAGGTVPAQSAASVTAAATTATASAPASVGPSLPPVGLAQALATPPEAMPAVSAEPTAAAVTTSPTPAVSSPTAVPTPTSVPTPSPQSAATAPETPTTTWQPTHQVVDRGTEVNFRTGPSTTFSVRMSLPPGAKLRFLQEEQDTSDATWMHFELADGTDGWIRSIDAVPITPG